MSAPTETSTAIGPELERIIIDPMAHESCDRCGYRAYVLVAIPVRHLGDQAEALPLAFCRHHFHAFELGLVAAGAVLKVDIREQLEARETAVHA